MSIYDREPFPFQRLRSSFLGFFFFREPLAKKMCLQCTTRPLPSPHAADDCQLCEFPVTVVLIVVNALVAIVPLAALTQEVTQQGPTYPLPSQQPAADQQPCEPLVATLLLLALDGIVIVCITAFIMKVRQQRPTHPLASQQATADQQPCEPSVATLLLAFDAIVVVLIFSVPSLAQQMPQQCAANLAATEQPTAHQQPREPPVPIRAFFLARDFISLAGVVFRLASFTQEMCDQQPPQPSLPQDAAARQQSDELTLVTPVFGHLAVAILIFLVSCQKFREKQAISPPAPNRAADRGETRKFLIVECRIAHQSLLEVGYLLI
jgi:hypothetical protein